MPADSRHEKAPEDNVRTKALGRIQHRRQLITCIWNNTVHIMTLITRDKIIITVISWKDDVRVPLRSQGMGGFEIRVGLVVYRVRLMGGLVNPSYIPRKSLTLPNSLVYKHNLITLEIFWCNS